MKVTMSKVLLFVWSFIAYNCLPAAAQKAPKMPVKVTINIASQADDKNLILFDRTRKLELKDFKGKPDPDSYGVAATYSGISTSMEGMSKKGVLEINVTLTIYFDRTKSWMKKEGKTDRVLAHEQNHFDLTAIKACALANAIQKEQYTSENVQQKIRALQAAHTQELSQLQHQYDKETKHGTIPDKQAGWSERIAKELAVMECM